MFIDINNDGITDILLSGVSNSFKNACIAILDPRFISGRAPATTEYRAEGIPDALEMAYIRIPQTILGAAVKSAAQWNSAGYMEIYEHTKSFRVDVADASVSDYLPGLQYEFKFDLSLDNIRTGSTYDRVAKELFQEGRLKQYPDAKYFKEFEKKILYWDGETFVNYPTFNKRYLEAVAKLKQPTL
jgi:hypothetical protein